MVVGRDHEHFPEVGRQLVGLAHIVDDLADRPKLGDGDEVALHQATGGLLAIGERFLDGRPVVGLHRPQHRALLIFLQVLDQGDGVVGVELGREIGHLLRLHLVDHILADIIVELGIDVGVDDARQRLDQVAALVPMGKFDEVGDIGRVEPADQPPCGLVVAVGNRVEHLADELGP